MVKNALIKFTKEKQYYNNMKIPFIIDIPLTKYTL
jgi:hypothetical protein